MAAKKNGLDGFLITAAPFDVSKTSGFFDYFASFTFF
jgi:hypothetical protein